MNDDLISRSALKERAETVTLWNGEVRRFISYETIDNAPTIERPQGEWIIDGHHYKCSRCGKTLAIMFSETDDDDLIGCPFCLADMRGGRE